MWGDTYSKQFKMIDARLVVALLVVMMVLYDVHLAAQAETSEPSSKVAHRKQELCGNNELKMTKLSQLAQIKTDACGPVVKRAFEEWKKIARDRDNVCTLDYASRLTRFYKTYLANMDSEKEDIPEQLRRFSIAYGMLVSATCKKQLIFEEFQDRHRLAESYLKEWVGKDGFVNRLLYPLPERAGILLPLDFSAMFPEFKDKYRQVLGLGEQKNRDKIKKECQHLYPPYLRDLAWAVMHLTRNGLQFESWELAHELGMSESWRLNLACWKRFIFLCEALEEVQPYIHESSYYYDFRHKPPAKIPLKGDRIIHWYDYRLESAVNSFNVNEKPENRLKDGLIKQSHWFAIAAADSNDKAAGVLKRAFEILKRPASGDRDKDLLVVKEDLLKLLDSKKQNGTIRKTFNVARELKYLVRLPVRTVDYLVYYIIRLLQGDRPHIISFD